MTNSALSRTRKEFSKSLPVASSKRVLVSHHAFLNCRATAPATGKRRARPPAGGGLALQAAEEMGWVIDTKGVIGGYKLQPPRFRWCCCSRARSQCSSPAPGFAGSRIHDR